MAPEIGQSLPAAIAKLATEQHGAVARWQLITIGMSPEAIRHRIKIGRFYPAYPGVYAVGRPQLDQSGRWLAAVLACGRGAVLSHASAAALWGLHAAENEPEVSVPPGNRARPAGIVVHRRGTTTLDRTTRQRGIPVTDPIQTLLDVAARASAHVTERMINDLDRLGLASVERLQSELEELTGRRGVRAVRSVLERRTFALTDSELERQFMRLVERAGLPLPLTRQRVNGFLVDFYWPDLGLVVETDGITYHRTPGQQARDRLRDQAHAMAGLSALRYTHAQIRFESDYVRRSLTQVVRRLQRETAPSATAEGAG